MAASWTSLCNAPGLSVHESTIAVQLGDGRGHRVAVVEASDGYCLTAVVLGRAAFEKSGVSVTRLWEMNRSLNLVGFRIDRKGRLVGEAWIPTLPLDSAEFQLVLRNLATECDRYEFMLTGKDVE